MKSYDIENCPTIKNDICLQKIIKNDISFEDKKEFMLKYGRPIQFR